MQLSHSSKVTAYLPTANAVAIDTSTCTSSLYCRSGSFRGDPIVKLPAGTTTMSGHSGQSLNCSVIPAPGLKQRCSFCPTETSIPSQRAGVMAAAGGTGFGDGGRAGGL